MQSSNRSRIFFKKNLEVVFGFDSQAHQVYRDAGDVPPIQSRTFAMYIGDNARPATHNPDFVWCGIPVERDIAVEVGGDHLVCGHLQGQLIEVVVGGGFAPVDGPGILEDDVRKNEGVAVAIPQEERFQNCPCDFTGIFRCPVPDIQRRVGPFAPLPRWKVQVFEEFPKGVDEAFIRIVHTVFRHVAIKRQEAYPARLIVRQVDNAAV